MLAVPGSLIAASVARALPDASIVQSANAASRASATRPALSRVLSGCFAGDLAGEVTGSLPPTTALRGWSVLLNGDRRPTGARRTRCAGSATSRSRAARRSLQFGYIPDFETKASATCSNPLARVVGGCFQTSSPSNKVPVTDSYPSGPSTWTVRTDAPSLGDIPWGTRSRSAACSR